MRVASQAVYFPASLLQQDNHTCLRTQHCFACSLTELGAIESQSTWAGARMES